MDIVIYVPETCEVLAILSCKISLRERIAQTAYWKIKFQIYKTTQHIKTFLVSPDSDEVFNKEEKNKQRIITEFDTDGAFIMGKVVESEKIKPFQEFADVLKDLARNARKES
jgi:type II restriction enzyme